MSIQEKLEEIKSIKENIKQSIIDKGVIISSSDNFATYPEKIASIESGITPTGSITLVSNETYNIATLAEAIVNVPQTVNNQNKTVTSNGLCIADNGYSGLGTITVNVPEPFSTKEIVDGKLKSKSYTTFTLPNDVTSIGELGLPYVCYNNTNITSTGLNNITSIGNYGLYYAFYGCTNLTSTGLDNVTEMSGSQMLFSAFASSGVTSTGLGNLVSIGDWGGSKLQMAFAYCDSLTTLDFHSLISINGYAMNYICDSCHNLVTVMFDSLEMIGSLTSQGEWGGLQGAFRDCTSLQSVTFPSLALINSQNALGYAFENCTSLQTLSFPALTSQSFGAYNNQFDNMLFACSNVTVHFPSNLQSVIGSWQDVINGFGGTNTTVLFDLTATE